MPNFLEPLALSFSGPIALLIAAAVVAIFVIALAAPRDANAAMNPRSGDRPEIPPDLADDYFDLSGERPDG